MLYMLVRCWNIEP